MSRSDGIKITETEISIFGESHTPFLVMEPLRRADGKYPDAIIVATQDPGGLVPRALMLPHQLYTDTAAHILASTNQRNLWVLPIYDSNEWTQVEPRHWVSDAPTSLHGNGAASFECTTRNRSEVTVGSASRSWTANRAYRRKTMTETPAERFKAVRFGVTSDVHVVIDTAEGDERLEGISDGSTELRRRDGRRRFPQHRGLRALRRVRLPPSRARLSHLRRGRRMSLEGHFCWEDCDEGPHGCICGNDCAPPHAEVPADNEREALVALIHDIRLRPVRSQMDEPFADAILAAGWRRQAPPTEAVLEAAEAAAGRFFAPRPWWMKNMVRAALEAARNTP